jgi:hypothetical protein
MRHLTARYTVAATLLCAWACAKSNDQGTGDDSYTPVPGKGGTSSTSGGSGGNVATGGSTAPTTGGSATGGSVSSGGDSAGGSTSGGTTGGSDVPGAGGSGATGGASATGGGPAAGGSVGMGGSVGTGGGVGMGGSVGTGGSGATGAGGTETGGTSSTGSGGTGGSGYAFDPNFKPPDMSFAKIVVMYTASNTTKSTSNIQFTINLKNQTDAAYPMGTVTVRYWLSSEPPPSTMLYYSSSNLSCKAAPTFVSNHANSYLEFSFAATGSLPPSTDPNAQNAGTLQGGVQAGSGVNAMFNQANDWSFDGTAAMSKLNGKITVYDGTTLIFGCEPTEVCAMPDDTTGGGAAGAGGAPAL